MDVGAGNQVIYTKPNGNYVCDIQNKSSCDFAKTVNVGFGNPVMITKLHEHLYGVDVGAANPVMHTKLHDNFVYVVQKVNVVIGNQFMVRNSMRNIVCAIQNKNILRFHNSKNIGAENPVVATRLYNNSVCGKQNITFCEFLYEINIGDINPVMYTKPDDIFACGIHDNASEIFYNT